MLVRNIFMELRSRLRSCNVYIITNVDFKKDCNLKISIQSNCIVLNYYNNLRRDSLSSIESLSDYSDDETETDSCVISVQEFCFLIPNSMSCLKINKNTISFRILTEPKNGGNFYTEFITATDNNIKVDKVDINLKCQDDVFFICANCCNVISNEAIKFDRILELPTSNLDMSEWFCHGHGHNHSHSNNIEVKPNKLDFLYRLTYFAINNNNLSEKTNKFNVKREVYHCNRCLAWLGIKNKDTVKLFNSEVKIKQDTEKYVFTHKVSTQNVTTDDFIYTIECMIKEFNLGLQYAMMCKIVLECTVSATKKQFLLIWVIDKELQVLRNTDRITDKVMLSSSFLTKVLYKIEWSLNDEVEIWLADPSVVSTEISKNMFSCGVEHLERMSLNMPESFRYTNGYCVSYLKA